MRDVYEMDEVWRQFFPEHPPARTIIPATRLAPLDCIVEINMIALEQRAGMERAQIVARDVPPPALHQPHAVRAGGLLFLSGLYATDSWDGPAADAALHPEMPYFGSAGRRQTEDILRRAGAICRAGGARLEDILWMQAYYTDLREFPSSLEAWQRTFPEAPPAAFATGVEAPQAVPGCSIAMDAVALTAG
jgi:enamine deaminase RidA (YjgF/YER057c/UK114 family)